MSLTTIAQAETQYKANLSWHLSEASAELALEAVRYLLAFRPKTMDGQGHAVSFDSLQEAESRIGAFLGAGQYRANGRNRRVSAGFGEDGIG